MGLPKQQHAIFNITIPSTGEKHKFRAFTVKEDNILSQAKESEDADTIANAVLEVMNNCFLGKLDCNTLATFDVEYILTNIRAKSVGETIDLQLSCYKTPTEGEEPCKKTIVRIDLTKATVEFPEGHSKNIPLYDDVGIIMRYPTIGELIKLENMSAVEAVIACIESIYDGDEIFNKDDHTKEELSDFIESLTESQMKTIKNKFFDKMPTYKMDIEFDCATCGTKNIRVIKGLNNFFI